MYVIKRNGQQQDIHFDKITERLKNLVTMHPPLSVDVIPVVQKVIAGVYPGMTTKELDTLSADTCVYMSTTHIEYETLASRITISNLHKETLDNYGELADKMYYHIHPIDKQHFPLLSNKCYNVIKKNLNAIQSALDYNKDYSYDYFGIKTLQKSYLAKLDGVIVERIQHMLMRVAVGMHPNDIDAIIRTYHLLSDKYYTVATPTLFNSGTPKPTLASCFLLQIQEDSLSGIYDTIKQTALISKSAGGISIS